MSTELKLWTNGVETVVARDPEHVLELYKQRTGDTYDAEDLGEWEERVVEGHLTILVLDEGDDGRRVTKSVAEWIADNGPGFLCSTEY